jgi:uncharacterized protein YbcC (UPF0753/DUF2309 family)
MSTAIKPHQLSIVAQEREAHHLAERIVEIVGEVSEVIAPVWPLRDYVAVNPYAGIASRSFMDARAYLQSFSDCETLMPLEHYALEFQRGKFSARDIEVAIAELQQLGVKSPFSLDRAVEKLIAISESRPTTEPSKQISQHQGAIRTIAEIVAKSNGIDWREVIVDEVSKHCAAHYDQGQAMWQSPYASLPLYQAWRSSASQDYNMEVLGLRGFRRFVSELPHTAEAAIAKLLSELGVPDNLWSAILLSQAFSIPGWSAWTKYQDHWTSKATEGSEDLTGLLAIRLAYDVALARSQSLEVNWDTFATREVGSYNSYALSLCEESILRYTLLRASEIAYRSSLLNSLEITPLPANKVTKRKLAQVVFCIDVRSERVRRQLESQSDSIETYGFAGFFGVGFEFVELGQSSGCAQLPVLLKPQFKLYEGLPESLPPQESEATVKRLHIRHWRSLWKSLQNSASSCFSFVETLGLHYGLRLFQRTLGQQSGTSSIKKDGLTAEQLVNLGPTLRGLNKQGLTTARQADIAEGMLRNLGLTDNFAELVVFCGHTSQTENNPLAAGLDCGACGGHSGEPNARFAALLLNQLYIRQALAERGIAIPPATHFVAAVHNTTTDVITFFDKEDLPLERRFALRELEDHCRVASQQTRSERAPTMRAKSALELFKRAGDWSEVRPEWGLAGNAAFIAAPRRMTQSANLNARSFLHSYDFRCDPDGAVLENIMTAPLIVANWINLQYYASAVDNHHFGSGTKTIHNVVGKFGILSGNGGDLQTGLPWQSLHTGQQYQHVPMRLQAVIVAPRAMIDRVIAKHQNLADLLDGQWLHLIAVEAGQSYRYAMSGEWELLA